MKNNFLCPWLKEWTALSRSREPLGSPFRVTIFTKAVALLAVVTLTILIPVSSAYAYLITYDAGLNPQMLQLLVLTHQIVTQAYLTEANTKESMVDLDLMRQVNQGRQITSTALAQLDTLSEFGKLLEDNPLSSMTQAVAQFTSNNGTVNTSTPEFSNYINNQPAAEQLRFNGSNFQGGNYAFTDNTANLAGLPASSDREPPEMVIPLTASANAILTGAETAYSSSSTAQNTVSAFNALYPSSRPIGNSLIADGVLVRQAQPFDNLYIVKIQEGTARTKMEFWGLQDGLTTKGLAYHVLTGVRPLRDAPSSRFNPTDTLSAGAYAAIEDYNRKAGASGAPQVRNTYANYAYYVTPGLLASARIRPGDRIEITPEILDSAKRLGPRYDTNVPNRIAEATQVDTLVPHRLVRARYDQDLMPVDNPTAGTTSTTPMIYQGVAVNPSTVPPAFQGQGVAVVGLSLPQVENYIGEIAGNDARLAVNQTITGIISQMMDYVNKIEQGLTMIRIALQVLRKASTFFNALEAVTQALNVIDQTIAKIQKDITDFTGKVFAYLEGKQIILNDRSHIVSQAQNVLGTVAYDKLAVAMEAQYWSNVGKH
jgi:hypothetical protein